MDSSCTEARAACGRRFRRAHVREVEHASRLRLPSRIHLEIPCRSAAQRASWIRRSGDANSSARTIFGWHDSGMPRLSCRAVFRCASGWEIAPGAGSALLRLGAATQSLAGHNFRRDPATHVLTSHLFRPSARVCPKLGPFRAMSANFERFRPFLSDLDHFFCELKAQFASISIHFGHF